MFGRLFEGSHVSSTFSVRKFLSTSQSPHLSLGLFTISISSWFSLGRLCVFRNFSSSFRLSNCCHIIIHSSLGIPFITVKLVVCALLLILVIWVFFFLSVARGWSDLITLDFSFHCFFYTLFYLSVLWPYSF